MQCNVCLLVIAASFMRTVTHLLQLQLRDSLVEQVSDHDLHVRVTGAWSWSLGAGRLYLLQRETYHGVLITHMQTYSQMSITNKYKHFSIGFCFFLHVVYCLQMAHIKLSKCQELDLKTIFRETVFPLSHSLDVLVRFLFVFNSLWVIYVLPVLPYSIPFSIFIIVVKVLPY